MDRATRGEDHSDFAVTIIVLLCLTRHTTNQNVNALGGETKFAGEVFYALTRAIARNDREVTLRLRRVGVNG
jgi:hypothetical protein